MMDELERATVESFETRQVLEKVTSISSHFSYNGDNQCPPGFYEDSQGCVRSVIQTFRFVSNLQYGSVYPPVGYPQPLGRTPIGHGIAQPITTFFLAYLEVVMNWLSNVRERSVEDVVEDVYIEPYIGSVLQA